MSDYALSGDVRITGVINDDEFSASGKAAGDPETGEYEVELYYESVRVAGTH